DLLLLQRHLENPDRLHRNTIGIDWCLGDALDHIHSFRHAAESGILAVERRLRRDADEELAAVAVGLARNADGGDDTALVLEVAGFAWQKVESAGTPQFPRVLGIFEEGIAALDYSVGHYAEEATALVVSLASEADELSDVLGSFVGREFEPERAQVGDDHSFQ